MRILACVLLLGCGRVGFDARALAGDGRTGDGTDGPGLDVAPPACTNFGTFAAPARLSVQTADDDWFATPTRGGLELFWYTCGASGCHIMHATRASTADPWGAPQQVSELVVGTNEVSPTLTADGLHIVFASDMTGSFHPMWSFRPTPSDPFASPPMDLTNTGGGTGVIDRDTFMTPDGLRLVFLSTRNGGQAHIFETTRPSVNNDFGTPVELTSLEAASPEIAPTLTPDGLEVFFASIRGAVGGFDIYRAVRPATDQPFGAATLVPELSSAMDDLSARISEDGATLYLNYDTSTAGGVNADLYSATRSCL